MLADAHGNVVHLGERECSLQRRHQKIVEEAPSPLLTAEVRAAMGAQAVEAARACGYTSAGTVEFIVSADRPDEFFFMEMNTRLQVEHPVTEMVYGVDLVEQQLARRRRRAAAVHAGRPAAARSRDRGPRATPRIRSRGFLPTGGIVRCLVEPGAGCRVDSGHRRRLVVGSDYDPMLAKVIAWGADRGRGAAPPRPALADDGGARRHDEHRVPPRLLADDDVRAGALDTGLVERCADTLLSAADPRRGARRGRDLAAARPADDTDPWRSANGWRHGGRAWCADVWRSQDRGLVTWLVRHRTEPPGTSTVDDATPPVASRSRADTRIDRAGHAGRRHRITDRHRDRGVTWIGLGGSSVGDQRPDPRGIGVRPEAEAGGLGRSAARCRAR